MRLCVQIFEQIYIGVIVMLVSMLALFGINNAPVQSILLVPLLAVAVLFRIAVARTFDRPMHNLSFHAAADLDRADKVRLLAALARVWPVRRRCPQQYATHVQELAAAHCFFANY